ncbi:MAG: sce7726 family protein, partial [Clostridia bacterium]|nr:sce7726 family protein [Clostridia bacterium]
MANRVTYPNIKKDMQMLYSKYSTIEAKSILYDNLIKYLDSDFFSSLEFEDIHEIYNRLLTRYYPNEICIKANFVKQILLSGKQHVTIFELPIGTSRTDLCKINGTSIAYEIKTDLDNYTRLPKQIEDYNKVFDQVYVICSEDSVEE